MFVRLVYRYTFVRAQLKENEEPIKMDLIGKKAFTQNLYSGEFVRL